MLTLAPLLVRMGGRTLYQAVALRWQWSRQKRRHADLYRSGPLLATPKGTHRLPGLLAPTTLYEGQDAFGRTFGMTQTAGNRRLHRGAAGQPAGCGPGRSRPGRRMGRRMGTLARPTRGDRGHRGVRGGHRDRPGSGQRLHAEVEHLVREDAPAFAKEALLQTPRRSPPGVDAD